jgi:hypothetical protein
MRAPAHCFIMTAGFVFCACHAQDFFFQCSVSEKDLQDCHSGLDPESSVFKIFWMLPYQSTGQVP